MKEGARKKVIGKIRYIFGHYFRRELSDEEVESFFNSLEKQTRVVLATIPNATEEDFDRYMNERAEICFSPMSINNEILKIIEKTGIEELETSSRYKGLGEISNAAAFCLALRKETGEQWMIKGQDNPDILLVRPNGDGMRNRPFHALGLEIMEIPVSSGIDFSDHVAIAAFIKEKKFQKRYSGIPHLLIHLNFNQEGLQLGKISEEIRSLEGNPFHQIWVKANITPDSQVVALTRIYPSFYKIDFDYIQDRELMY